MKLWKLAIGMLVLAGLAGLAMSNPLFRPGPAPDVVSEAPAALALGPDTVASARLFAIPAIIETGIPRRSTDTPRMLRSLQAQKDDLDPIIRALAPPPWQATIEAEDTLSAVLTRAGMDASLRAEIALAVAAEFDLRRLKPGHRVSVSYGVDGSPQSVMLAVGDGIRIEVIFDKTLTARTLTPASTVTERAAFVSVNGSIGASLDRAGLPSRFAVDLVQFLGDVVDFRRDIRGGEQLRVLWTEAILPDGSQIGQPQISYAALDLGGIRFEIVWSTEESGHTTVYKDGKIIRAIAPPVQGARLSSVFGRRRHPVFGDVRMHTGVDYAARYGAPVTVTASGDISFVGWRKGYGRVIEVTHGSNMMTRYAHLSAVREKMEIGRRIEAGQVIGAVGKTGTATAPNLHYEIRIDGRAIDPLKDDRLVLESIPDMQHAVTRLEDTRSHFAVVLDKGV